MTEFELLALVSASFFAAIVSVLAGMGGGIFLLAMSTLIFPITIVIPLNGAFFVGAQFSRVVHFFKYIDWPTARAFTLGALAGAAIGAKTYSLMSELIITLMLAVTILLTAWMPPVKSNINVLHPFLWIGVCHTWISTITGVGGLMQGAMLRSGNSRNIIVGTIAGSLLTMSILKTIGYVWVGFDYSPYLLAISLSIATGFLGTWVGKRYINLISEQQFRTVMRWILTLFAIRLLWSAGQHIAG